MVVVAPNVILPASSAAAAYSTGREVEVEEGGLPLAFLPLTLCAAAACSSSTRPLSFIPVLSCLLRRRRRRRRPVASLQENSPREDGGDEGGGGLSEGKRGEDRLGKGTSSVSLLLLPASKSILHKPPFLPASWDPGLPGALSGHGGGGLIAVAGSSSLSWGDGADDSVDADAIKKPQYKQQQQQNNSSSMQQPQPQQQQPPPQESTELVSHQQEVPGGGGGGFHSSNQKTNWRLLGLGMFFLFYLCLGATVFSAIERPLEQRIVEHLLKKKADFLGKHQCLSDDELEDFMGEIVSANNRGVEIFKNGTPSVSSWSFGQAFFFSSTVVTTIGYGHQSPLSSEGKVFCIAYAVIGIPMTLLLLAAVVERALIPVNAALGWMIRAAGDRYQPVYVHVAHFLLLTLLVISVMFLLPALAFASLEPHWGFLDSLYYCFISLTTIGLGDFIPGDSPGQQWRPLYKACTTFYLLFGVTAMMLTLAVFYNIPRCDLKALFLLSPGAGCLNGRNGLPSGDGAGGSGGGQAGDPERIRLQTATAGRGPKYTQHLDERDAEDETQRRKFIRARSRPNDDDSPADSPVEEAKPRPGTSRGGGGRSKGGGRRH